MPEQGVVTRLLPGKLAEVGCRQNEACSKCGVCRTGAEAGMLIVEADNTLGAQINDIVEFEIPTELVVKGSFTLFLVPVIALFIGYLLGAKVVGLLGGWGSEETFGIIFGLLALASSFLAVRWYDQNIVSRSASRAKIVRIKTA
jgi:sigma-E factor negative regulatory protein RseC